MHRLEISEERFALAASGANIGIWDWLDIDGEAQWWSSIFYELLGYQDGELPPTVDNFWSFFHPEDVEITREALKAHFDQTADFKIEYRLKLKNGDYRWFLGSGQALRDEAGRPVRMIGSIMDIHQLKRTQEILSLHAEWLEQSNRELDNFAYMASHDLRAPLRGMDNVAQWIVEDLGENVDRAVLDKLDLLRGRVERMDTLLTDILAYSRAGKHESDPDNVDCNVLLDEVTNWAGLPEGFVVRAESGLPTIFASRTLLEQTFLNLVSNGIKHHDRSGGTIIVRYRPSGRHHEFIVEDDGPGIPDGYHERIFQMFQTLQSRDKVEGSGIGLAMVKKMIETNGGRVWVTSRPEERGTKFHFTIPIATDPKIRFAEVQDGTRSTGYSASGGG